MSDLHFRYGSLPFASPLKTKLGNPMTHLPKYRPVVPGCAGCAMAHPIFRRSDNPISTRGDRLCPPNYYWHTQIFRPSDGPAYDFSQILWAKTIGWGFKPKTQNDLG